MEIIDENTVGLDRELSELDNFVLKFMNILSKYADYVLISGYVAILFGRTRTTEDVDVFIEKISKKQFNAFYQELRENGFWALNAEDENELFGMLQHGLAVRFAMDRMVTPNVEVKFAKDGLDMFSLKEKTKVITPGGALWISRIAMQIAYKKFVLKSQKDIEDARHLQKLFVIPDEKINKYKTLFKQYGRI